MDWGGGPGTRAQGCTIHNPHEANNAHSLSGREVMESMNGGSAMSNG